MQTRNLVINLVNISVYEYTRIVNYPVTKGGVESLRAILYIQGEKEKRGEEREREREREREMSLRNFVGSPRTSQKNYQKKGLELFGVTKGSHKRVYEIIGDKLPLVGSSRF